jgi:hypothetical protein
VKAMKNLLKSLPKDSVRYNTMTKMSLLADPEAFHREASICSENYKRVSSLIHYMKCSTHKLPRLKAFIWTIESREMYPEFYPVSNEDEFFEQAKAINSILSLQYWN